MKKLFQMKKELIVLFAALVAAIILPLIFKGIFIRNVLILTVIWTIIGSGWNVLGGYAGQVSNGHGMFYGIGAYAVGLMLRDFKLSPWISIWIGVIVSMVIAYIIGWPLLRLKGHYFAIATMALTECMRIVFNNLKYTNGALGVYLYDKELTGFAYMQFTNDLYYYYIFLAFAVAILLLIKYFSKKKLFYYFLTIKGNEDAAASVGIDVAKYKRIAYMLSAGIVSIGGSLYAQYLRYTDPSMTMTLNISMMIVLVTIMGGIGTVIGPVLGAIILSFTSQYTRAFLGQFGGLDLIIYGILVILIILFLPSGLMSIPEKIKHRRMMKGGQS